MKVAEHQFKDRLQLKPFLGRELQFEGVWVRTRMVKTVKHQNSRSMTVVSVKCLDKPIELNHLSLLVRPAQLKNIHMFQPLCFFGEVNSYNARHNISVDGYNMVVYEPTYGLTNVRGFFNRDELPSQGLSKWCWDQVKFFHLDPQKYEELPNDGSRELQLIKDNLNKRRTVIKEKLG